jgi:hypothetical protein
MKKVIFLLPFLLLFFLNSQAQSAFGAQGGLNLQSAAKPAQTQWESTAHDFGQIPEGSPVSFSFEVKNTGQQPLTIEHVKPSCGCTIADYTEEEIAPGETGYVKATYKADKAGLFNKSITVRTNADEPITVLRIKGEVK